MSGTPPVLDLEPLSTVMRAHSVRYVVIGGIAMKRASGRPRDLEDATAVMRGD